VARFELLGMSEHAQQILANIGLEANLVLEILAIGHLKRAKAGQALLTPESTTQEMPIVLTGLLKVMRQNAHQDEVFLYYIEAGETCAMSITCCLEAKKVSYKVVAEEDTTMWMIPTTFIDSWIIRYPSFRRFVFQSYQTRFEELMATIDTVVFHKMDQRLYQYLLDTKQATGSFEIHKTHQQIADELNTSRVVVSRLLKQLENEGKLEHHRNQIDIL